MKRYLLIKNGDREYVFVADAEIVTDSSALGHALSLIDPGDEYTVRFTYKQPRMVKGRDWWSAEGRDGGYDIN